jgi:hypothetical protein
VRDLTLQVLIMTKRSPIQDCHLVLIAMLREQPLEDGRI